MMNARVKLVCPVCDIELSCMVIDREEHPKNWVLSIPSSNHLADRKCKKPELTQGVAA